MDIFNSKKFILLMIVILVWAGVSGCTPTEYDKQAPHETEQEMNAKITKEMEAMDREQQLKDNPGPTNFEGIADVLGCMFAPDDCPLKKRKEEQELDR
jgi:hypothetical protein